MENPENQDKKSFRAFRDAAIVRFRDRLKEAIGEESNNSFAIRCGLSEKTIRKYLKGDAFPTLDSLYALADASNKSIEWLTSGYGATELQKAENNANGLIKFNSKTHVLVPELNIKVAAGNGVYPLSNDEEQIGQFIFSKYWLVKEGLSNAKLSIFHVVGDSMETTINDGDIVLVNVREEGWIGALNGIFVILVNDLLMVKRIQYDMINNGFHVKSDNSIYDPYFIKPDDGMMFKVVAKVERVLTKMRPTKQF